MSLYYILYQSRALIDIDDPEQNRMLRTCQRNNLASDITGFLHREGNYFIQYLEGSKEAIQDTYARIEKDHRHIHIKKLDSGPLKSRFLPDWQMGFTNPDRLTLKEFFEFHDDNLNLRLSEPFDIVVFMVNNADLLREEEKNIFNGNSGKD